MSLQQLLEINTMCTTQYDGYPCNSCFHTVIESDYGSALNEDVHEYWLAVLGFRGDYPDLKGYKPKLLKELIEIMEIL